MDGIPISSARRQPVNSGALNPITHSYMNLTPSLWCGLSLVAMYYAAKRQHQKRKSLNKDKICFLLQPNNTYWIYYNQSNGLTDTTLIQDQCILYSYLPWEINKQIASQKNKQKIKKERTIFILEDWANYTETLHHANLSRIQSALNVESIKMTGRRTRVSAFHLQY